MAGDINEGKVLKYRSPRTQQEWTARIGMVIFLASWGMLFVAMFFTYVGTRIQASVWPPVEYPALPLALPGLNTVLIGISSIVLHWGVSGLRTGNTKRLGPALSVATGVGTIFLASQLYMWFHLYDVGLKPSSGVYGSVFFGFTWVHAAHVLVGLIALGVMTARAFFGNYTPARYLSIRLWSMYWHFVGAIWFILFLTVYVY